MELRTFSTTSYLKISSITNDFEFFGNMRLSKGIPGLDNRIFNQVLIEQIGKGNLLRFIETPYIWSIIEVEKDHYLPNSNGPDHSALNFLANFLWFIKDNSVNVDITYSYIPSRDTKNLVWRTKGGYNSNCQGNFEDTEFSVDDFNFALKVYNRVAEFSTNPIKEESAEDVTFSFKVNSPKFNTAPYNDNGRVARAISFLNIARQQSFLPLKIAFYVAIIECLFTVGNTEVQHKSCEKAAFYINDDNKLEIYKTFKDAYTLRSNFFHGQKLDRKLHQLATQKELSLKVDGYLRIILNKAVFETSEIFTNDAELTKHFEQLIFGNPL